MPIGQEPNVIVQGEGGVEKTHQHSTIDRHCTLHILCCTKTFLRDSALVTRCDCDVLNTQVSWLKKIAMTHSRCLPLCGKAGGGVPLGSAASCMR